MLKPTEAPTSQGRPKWLMGCIAFLGIFLLLPIVASVCTQGVAFLTGEDTSTPPTPIPEEDIPRDVLIISAIYDQWVQESSYSQKQNFIYACSKQGFDGMVTGDQFAARVIGEFQDYLARAGVEDPIRGSIAFCMTIKENRFTY